MRSCFQQPRMRYNWQKIAENGSLPMQFRHSLVYIKDDLAKSAKVYAVGTNEMANEGLEVYELDSSLESWTKITASFEDDKTRESVSIGRHGHVLAGVGSAIYVIGGASDFNKGEILKFDTVEKKWYSGVVYGDFSEEPVFAAALGGKIVVLGGVPRKNELAVQTYFLDTAKSHWLLPNVLGVLPSLQSEFSATTLGKERILLWGDCCDKDVWILEVGTPYVQSQKGAGEEAVAWSTGKRSTVPIVICGPSGVGKGTLIGKLMKEFPEKFGFSVSHTTRLPREKEIDGVHYHFTTRDSMELAVEEGKFLEHAKVHGNLYGTSIAAVEDVSDAGKRCILDIDVQGAQSVKKSSIQALYIFIAPPSFEELERRLRGRGTETEEQVTKRLQTAKRELELGKDSLLFDHVLVNDDLETTYKQLKDILGLQDNNAEIPTLKLVTSRNGLRSQNGPTDVYLLDTSNIAGGAPEETQGLNWLKLEPTDKQIPGGYTNALHLSDLEILLTGGEGDTIVLRVGK